MSCDNCNFSEMNSKAQFMYSKIMICEKCSQITRPEEDRIDNTQIPEQEKRLLD
jgi:hypothetical protein